jgi:sulfatase maturation enzyme AslB (radical SAM superfamily)
VNASLFPVVRSKAAMREESEGGILFNGTGSFRMITNRDCELIRRIDGQHTAYDVARSMSSLDTDLASNLIRLFAMARDGDILLLESGSDTPEPIKLSAHRTFSEDSFITPVLVSLGLTSSCNRRCGHCYRSAFEDAQDMSPRELRATIELLAQLDIAELNLTGGEPCLNPHLLSLVTSAASIMNSVTMSTNGTLLGRSSVLELGRVGLKRIQVGANVILDSLDEQQSTSDRE